MSTRTYPRPPHFLLALAGTIAALLGSSRMASADNGVWTDSTGSGLWSDTSKWNAGIVADGSGFTADFSTLDLLATEKVHLDSARTITGLAFGDANPIHDWILDNNGTSTNTLTLAGAPTISVTNQTATISAGLMGTADLPRQVTAFWCCPPPIPIRYHLGHHRDASVLRNRLPERPASGRFIRTRSCDDQFDGHAGGLLAPGTGVGTLNAGNVTFAGNSTLKLDISSSTTDTVLATGTVSLTATIVLDITLAPQPNPNTTFTIVNSTGGILGYAGGGRLGY